MQRKKAMRQLETELRQSSTWPGASMRCAVISSSEYSSRCETKPCRFQILAAQLIRREAWTYFGFSMQNGPVSKLNSVTYGLLKPFTLALSISTTRKVWTNDGYKARCINHDHAWLPG